MMQDTLKEIDAFLQSRKDKPLPAPEILYGLFRELAKWVLSDIEKKLDESADLPAETWSQYQRIAKEIRDVMEEGGSVALLEHEGTPEDNQVYQQWSEVRDKANELEYDIGEVLRKLEEATDQVDE